MTLAIEDIRLQDKWLRVTDVSDLSVSARHAAAAIC